MIRNWLRVRPYCCCRANREENSYFHTFIHITDTHKDKKKDTATCFWTDESIFTCRDISDCVKLKFSVHSIPQPSATTAAPNMATVNSHGRQPPPPTHSFIHTLYCVQTHTPHQGRPHIRWYFFVPIFRLHCRLCRPDPDELFTDTHTL